jgi:hypothetical protein
VYKVYTHPYESLSDPSVKCHVIIIPPLTGPFRLLLTITILYTIPIYSPSYTPPRLLTLPLTLDKMSVRKSPPPPGPGVALTKRARVEDEEDDSRNMTLTVASSGEGQRKNAMIRTIQRTSGLEAPIVALGGAHGVCLLM